MVIHVVAPGETLWVISRRYGVSIAAIVSANAIADPNVLVVGEALAIPLPRPEPAPLTYVVRRGDTLAAIAGLFSTTVQSIALANQITDVNLVYVGQELVVPGWTYQTYTVRSGDTLSRVAAAFSTRSRIRAAEEEDAGRSARQTTAPSWTTVPP